MHFSMDRWKTQHLRLSLPPPPQCYILWIDCARAALLTQPWRMWREGLHKSPWHYQFHGSTAPWATGTGAQVLYPGSVKPFCSALSRPPLITEASMGLFNIRQAQTNLGAQQKAPQRAGGWNIWLVRRGCEFKVCSAWRKDTLWETK